MGENYGIGDPQTAKMKGTEAYVMSEITALSLAAVYIFSYGPVIIRL